MKYLILVIFLVVAPSINARTAEEIVTELGELAKENLELEDKITSLSYEIKSLRMDVEKDKSSHKIEEVNKLGSDFTLLLNRKTEILKRATELEKEFEIYRKNKNSQSIEIKKSI
jgi:hypothetical protein